MTYIQLGNCVVHDKHGPYSSSEIESSYNRRLTRQASLDTTRRINADMSRIEQERTNAYMLEKEKHSQPRIDIPVPPRLAQKGIKSIFVGKENSTLYITTTDKEGREVPLAVGVLSADEKRDITNILGAARQLWGKSVDDATALVQTLFPIVNRFSNFRRL